MEGDLTAEEVAEILDWAVTAGAAVVLMQHHPKHSNSREAFEMLRAFQGTVGSMYEDIPDCLRERTYALAEATIENVNHEEEIVEEFVKELDEFNGA